MDIQSGLKSELGRAKMAIISSRAEIRHVIATKFQLSWPG